MKKIIISICCCALFAYAHSQDSMVKKMDNKTDKMVKKMDNTIDPMNKKLPNRPDTVKTPRIVPKKDSLRKPKPAGK